MEARLEGGSRGGVSGDLGKIMRSKQSIRGRSFPVCLSWEQRDFFFYTRGGTNLRRSYVRMPDSSDKYSKSETLTTAPVKEASLQEVSSVSNREPVKTAQKR